MHDTVETTTTSRRDSRSFPAPMAPGSALRQPRAAHPAATVPGADRNVSPVAKTAGKTCATAATVASLVVTGCVGLRRTPRQVFHVDARREFRIPPVPLPAGRRRPFWPWAHRIEPHGVAADSASAGRFAVVRQIAGKKRGRTSPDIRPLASPACAWPAPVPLRPAPMAPATSGAWVLTQEACQLSLRLHIRHRSRRETP